MNRSICVLLSILISTALILAGCSAMPSPVATAPSTAINASSLSTQAGSPDDSASVNAGSAKVYEFKFTDQFTAQQTNGKLDELLGRIISEKTSGQVKFTYYHSESLGKVADFFNMINGGVVDAASITPVSFPAQLDMDLGVELPGLGIPDRQARMDLTWELYNKGYFVGLAPYKILGFQPTPNVTLFLKKKALTIGDLKGLKLRTSSNPMAELAKLLGASPLAVPFTDVYMNLDRGVIDGVITPYEAFAQGKFYEVCKYAVADPLASGAITLVMGKKAWDSIPPELQVKVDEAIQAYRTSFLDEVMPGDSTWAEMLAGHGMEVYSFSSEEAAKLKELISPVKTAWIDERQPKGLLAREMMDHIDTFLAGCK